VGGVLLDLGEEFFWEEQAGIIPNETNPRISSLLNFIVAKQYLRRKVKDLSL